MNYMKGATMIFAGGAFVLMLALLLMGSGFSDDTVVASDSGASVSSDSGSSGGDAGASGGDGRDDERLEIPSDLRAERAALDGAGAEHFEGGHCGFLSLGFNRCRSSPWPPAPRALPGTS